MFRLKLVLVLLVGVVFTTAAIYFYLPSQVESSLRKQLTTEVATAASSLESFERLNDFSVRARAQRIAGFEGMRSSLTQEYNEPVEYERHLGVYNKGLLRWKYAFENLQKAGDKKRAVESDLHERPPYMPELVFVTDDKGVSVAALGTNKYDWYKIDIARQHPALMSVADGTPRKDIWMWKWNEGDTVAPYHVGLAPVMEGEKMLGTVVVGSLISDGSARMASDAIGGQDVAYFVGDRVVASTMSRDEELSAALFQGASPIGEGNEPPVFSLKVGQDEYLAAVRYFLQNADSKAPKAGFLVLVPVTARLGAVQQARTSILVCGVLLLILLLASVLWIVRNFIKPLEEIDQGIQEVIAGNKDYTFQVSGSSTFSSEMAQSLNLMSAYLQGKRMPDEEEEAGDWSDFFVGNVTQTAIMRAVNKEEAEQALKEGRTPATVEPRKDYQERIFKEYLAARRGLGLQTEDLTLERFIARLDKHSQDLKKRHKAREIRFSVILHDGKVVLKPHPIF